MGVPALLLVTAAAIELHESDPPLDQAARDQALAPEIPALLFIEAVHVPCLSCLFGYVHRLRGVALHLESELIRCDPGFQIALSRAIPQMLAIHFLNHIDLGALQVR